MDLPHVQAKNEFNSLLHVILPDMRVYPIPFGDRAPEPVWIPVWQKACAWRVCGFAQGWQRTSEQVVLYSSLHLFSGVTAKLTLTTSPLLLARSNDDGGNTVKEVGGEVFPELRLPVASMLSVRRPSGDYVLVACDSDGSSSALSASSLHVQSLVYRVGSVSVVTSSVRTGNTNITMQVAQRLHTKGARQWAGQNLQKSAV